MGKIWLETTKGKLIHLPVVGDDVNSPDDAVRIPTSVFTKQNRCYGEQFQIEHPTYGTITLDLRPPGIAGECNQCGVCCSHPIADCPHPPGDCRYPSHPNLDYHVCQYLTIYKWRKWGDPDNSECSIFSTILDNFKGCAYPPDTIDPCMTNCGYYF